MATIKKFVEILSWKEVRILNSHIGKLMDEKKSGNNYRLINQMKGTAGFIMDNLAEGFERSGNKEFLQFFYIAKGFCGELRSQLYRAVNRNKINAKKLESHSFLSLRISSLIQKLITFFNNSAMKGLKIKNRTKTPQTSATSETSAT